MNKQTIEKILKDVKYKDWTFHVEERDVYESTVMATRKALYFQAHFPDADLVTGEVETQHGRKWILSEHMTRSEIVTTAFKAVITAEEHEIREKFRYKKRMIFGPHFDVEALWEVARRIEVRDDPKSVAQD